VERAFGTLQDRLVKELRLANIATIVAANALLPEFVADYDQRFGCQPFILTAGLKSATWVTICRCGCSTRSARSNWARFVENKRLTEVLAHVQGATSHVCTQPSPLSSCPAAATEQPRGGRASPPKVGRQSESAVRCQKARRFDRDASAGTTV
jgi:hypothetical protein